MMICLSSSFASRNFSSNANVFSNLISIPFIHFDKDEKYLKIVSSSNKCRWMNKNLFLLSRERERERAIFCIAEKVEKKRLMGGWVDGWNDPGWLMDLWTPPIQRWPNPEVPILFYSKMLSQSEDSIQGITDLIDVPLQ